MDNILLDNIQLDNILLAAREPHWWAFGELANR